MFAGKEWIFNDYKKIKNPIKFKEVNQIYEGNLQDDFDFKFQQKNFNNIKTSLQIFGIFPSEIYLANRVGKTIFVVTWTDPNLFWHKYEGEKYGSGQNYIYWKSHQIKTTDWIKLTQNNIAHILNDVNPIDIIN